MPIGFRKKFLQIIFIITITCVISLPAISTDFTILHTSDIHGNLFPSKNNEGGLSRRVHIANTYKDNILIADTGDYYQGSIYNSLYKWKYTTAYMKYSKYNIATFGNHEFDNGLYNLKSYLKHTKTNFISTNLKFNDKYFQKRIKPYKIFNIGNEKILVLGITTPKLKDLTNIQNVEILNTFEVLKKYIKEIPHDKVVLLSHCGLDFDKKIAKNVNGIDIILGGHDHIYKVIEINNTLITHTGEYGYSVNKIVYNTTLNKFIQSYIPINEKTGNNSFIDKKLNKVQKKSAKFLNKKIAYVTVPLDGRKEYLRSQQTNLGKLILKAMSDEFENKYDVIFINAGAIRTDGIIKGDITIADIYQMLPFENKVIKGTIDGKTLKEILKKGSQSGKSYLQYISKTIQIYDNKLYTIITLDYLYKGGDGYNELQNLNIKRTSEKYTRDVLIEYLANYQTLDKI